MENVGIYIHIPFCIKKCNYCDFNSFSADRSVMEKYVSYLTREFYFYKDIFRKKKISTIFIGGGTPSILDIKEIDILVKDLKKYIDLSSLKEFTIEINPGTVNIEKLEKYMELGINRLSFGIQSFNDDILTEIGRIHSSEDAKKSVIMAKKVGFTNISCDLMYNLPNQNIDDILSSIEQAIKLKVDHISLYSLIIEENTKFYELNEKGKLNLMSEEFEDVAFEKSYDLLKLNGFNRYEISNYSKVGKESLHNIIYWNNKEYFGFGLGSHGKLGNVRYNNFENLKDYFEKIDLGIKPIKEEKELSTYDNIFETIMVGFRLSEGINIDEVNCKYGISILEYYQDEINKFLEVGFIKIENGRMFLTNEGMNLSNYILSYFVK